MLINLCLNIIGKDKFGVYLVSMFLQCPIKNARKSPTTFPLDSAMNICISKHVRRTYGLHWKQGNTYSVAVLLDSYMKKFNKHEIYI